MVVVLRSNFEYIFTYILANYMAGNNNTFYDV